MPVQFKFRGEKAFRTLLNVTTPCTLQRVKQAIYEQARISDQTTDLALEDSSGRGVLDPRALFVQDALVQVVVRRTPVQNRVEPVVSLVVPSDDPVAVALEDQAIDRMVEQHDVVGLAPAPSSTLIRYSRSYRAAVQSQARQRQGYDLDGSDDDEEAKQEEPPPPGYTCHRCGMTGGKLESHWIWECPTNEDPDHLRKVRTARGVPRQFLQKVATIEEGQAISDGGVTFTLPGHSGHYIIAHQNATVEEQKRRLGDTVHEKVTAAFTDGAKMSADRLKCPLCHQIFRQAVISPCCGSSFCSDCIVDRLAHSSKDHGLCPGCGKEVFAHQMVANEDIRHQVAEITKASKAKAVASEKIENSKPKLFEVDSALKDRINRPKKYALEAPAPGSADGRPLALTDAVPPAPTHDMGADWQPLGFGVMLNAEEFARWQKAARGPVPTAVRELFVQWQHKMRQARPNPPSKEEFEVWQKQLCRDSTAVGASGPNAGPVLQVPPCDAGPSPGVPIVAVNVPPAPTVAGRAAPQVVMPMVTGVGVASAQEPKAKKAKKEKKSKISAADL